MPLNPAPNFPTSLDSLPDPTSANYVDDDGFELDLLLQKYNAIMEALEAKLGVGASTPVAGSALIAAASPGQSLWSPMPRKNRIINGSFPVWQRGTAGPTTADNAYGPDRWRVLGETTGTGFVIAREATDVPAGGARYAAKLSIGASNNTKNGLFTPLEGVDMWDLRNGVASLQFKLKVSDARIGDVRAALLQWTGTEDAISADPISAWGAAGTNPTPIASWGMINTPANLGPTTSWATYKLENLSVSQFATNLALLIWIDDKTTTAGDYILVTDVQLELGAVCTAVERRHIGQEIALCERYYQKSYEPDTAPATNTALAQIIGQASVAIAGTTAGSLILPQASRFPVPMRAAPTVVIYSVAGTANAILTAGATERPGVTANTPSRWSPWLLLSVDNSSAVAIADRAQIQCHYTASAEL